MPTSRTNDGLATARSTRRWPLRALFALALLCGFQLAGVAQPAPLETAAWPRVILVDDSFAYAPCGPSGSAAWVCEFITREMIEGDKAQRPASFYADRELPGELRAALGDYSGGSLDRGHLAPDGNVRDEQAKLRRMRLSNVVPQSPGLNRGLWRKLEEHVRELVREHGAAFVVTAPLYQRQGEPRTVGSVLVPTHLVKCVLVLDVDQAKLNGGRLVAQGVTRVAEPLAMHAWIVPNQSPPDGTSLETYRRTVDACEELLLLDLFAWLDDAIENRMEAGRMAEKP